ncbi:MAG: cell division protein ZipA [Alteromonadaceae bacterium]|nr:MAG: cell division protein ZipA [Alteromonadaceae bacterium]
MKDWLSVILVLLIIGVFLDGIRRMRLAKKANIKLSKNAKKADLVSGAADGARSSEFPSGGARVVEHRDEDVAEDLNKAVRQNYQGSRQTRGAPRRIPEQVSLNLEESVPMLMDSVELEEAQEDNKQAIEPQVGSMNVASLPAESAEGDVRSAEHEAVISEMSDSGENVTQADYDDRDDSDEEIYVEPDEVLVMNVMAKSGTCFPGEGLLNTLMDQGLKLGEMDIFHRHRNNDGDGAILFSLANMVVPGTFNLAQMADFQTPGVSLFLSLPIKGDSLDAYNDMATTARAIAESLGGELKDENRSVMTQQTIEHGRQRVIEYERKRKLVRA